MKIIWTTTARRTYLKVLDFLVENWTKKEVANFVSEVESLLNQITNNPEMFRASRKKKNVRKGLINKHNTVITESSPGIRSLN